MSTEITTPFQLAPDGGIAAITDPNEQAEQHIKALVATGPGERVILSGYGVNTRNSVFAPNNPVLAQALQNDIAQQMKTWEPDLILNGVSAEAQSGVPADQALLTVNWSTKSAQNPNSPGVFTATILVGGDVV